MEEDGYIERFKPCAVGFCPEVAITDLGCDVVGIRDYVLDNNF